MNWLKSKYDDLMKIVIQPSDVKDYLDWMKHFITVCLAAIGALLLKSSSGELSFSLKVGAALFVFSMIFLLGASAGLIEHKNSEGSVVSRNLSWALWLGFIFFVSAFFALVVELFR